MSTSAVDVDSKKVLMIGFIYPPLGGSGVQRTLKFSKYLPESGWQPYVVCSDDPQVFADGMDPSMVAEIPPEVKVWRREFVSPLGLRRRVQRMLRVKPRAEIACGLVQPSQSTLAMTGGGVQPSQGALSTNKEIGWKKGLRRIFQLLTAPLAPFEFPPVDAALYWALAIVPGCLRLIRKEKIELIYTTSFPYSDHVVGYFLKKLTGKPWVADFRDPWTQHAGSRNTGWRYKVDCWVEQRVLNTADKVIGVTPTYIHRLHTLAPLRSADDFIAIENGYDQLDFSNPGERKPPDITTRIKTEIAHVGFVYDGTALPFLRALERLGDDGANFCCRFVGGIAPQERLWLSNHSVTTDLRVEPRLSHEQAIETMRSVDVLLLLLGTDAGWIGNYPGKLFEYLASGTPILLVGPNGISADLIMRSGTGCFVDANDEEGLVTTLRLISLEPKQFRELYFHPRSDEISVFERHALTLKLSNLFNQLL